MNLLRLLQGFKVAIAEGPSHRGSNGHVIIVILHVLHLIELMIIHVWYIMVYPSTLWLCQNSY